MSQSRICFLVAYYRLMLRNWLGGKIAGEHGVVKAKGSCATEDTPAQKNQGSPTHSLQPNPDLI